MIMLTNNLWGTDSKKGVCTYQMCQNIGCKQPWLD